MRPLLPAALFAGLAAAFAPASAAEICQGHGPQAPRDIASAAGANTEPFSLAPAGSTMNLCNIHTHTNAEHEGPGFCAFAGATEHGGYRCNETDSLTEAEFAEPAGGHGADHGVKPGDTIEMHWICSTCALTPGEGLGSCLSEACANPQRRVESQLILAVNDPKALDFNDVAYGGNIVDGPHQARHRLPQRLGRGRECVQRDAFRWWAPARDRARAERADHLSGGHARPRRRAHLIRGRAAS